jgi:hypothetical protein
LQKFSPTIDIRQNPNDHFSAMLGKCGFKFPLRVPFELCSANDIYYLFRVLHHTTSIEKMISPAKTTEPEVEESSEEEKPSQRKLNAAKEHS